MTSLELFAARSKMKLDNARKLVKPELLIDETNAHHVIVDRFSKPIQDKNQRVNDSEVDEDQKVLKVMRKLSSSTAKPRPDNKSLIKSDWKPSKLKKNLEKTQAKFSRYKQVQPSTFKSKVPSTNITSITEKSINNNVFENNTIKSTRMDRYQEYKYKLVPKLRGNKFRGPKPSHIEGIIQDNNPISTTKIALVDKPRKTFTSRKNDKSYVEDIKAVALKLRKTLENMEKNQISKPVRKNEPMEGSTTLLTTMRTIKSFSFSTRLAKMDSVNSIGPSTMKMVDDQIPLASLPTSTSSFFVTETVTQNLTENEITTSAYDNILLVNNHSSSYNIANQIKDPNDSSTSDLLVKKTHEIKEVGHNWKELNLVAKNDENEPRTAALTNDSGSSLFIVYPSVMEKPSSIAITPKAYKYETTAKPEEGLSSYQMSVTQKPIISVKVSSSDGSSSSTTLLRESRVDSQNAAIGITKSTNIFSPSKSAAILETGNITILEHLRSTVAPLLSTLGAKSPAVPNVYKHTNSAVIKFLLFYRFYADLNFNPYFKK
jgi:hypothetical protein